MTPTPDHDGRAARASRADHSLRLDQNGHPVYGWRLVCDHDDPRPGVEEDGSPDPDADPHSCWLQTWWAEQGMEMVEDGRRPWPSNPAVVIPVAVEGDGWGDGPLLVPPPTPSGGDETGGDRECPATVAPCERGCDGECSRAVEHKPMVPSNFLPKAPYCSECGRDCPWCGGDEGDLRSAWLEIGYLRSELAIARGEV